MKLGIFCACDGGGEEEERESAGPQEAHSWPDGDAWEEREALYLSRAGEGDAPAFVCFSVRGGGGGKSGRHLSSQRVLVAGGAGRGPGSSPSRGGGEAAAAPERSEAPSPKSK